MKTKELPAPTPEQQVILALVHAIANTPPALEACVHSRPFTDALRAVSPWLMDKAKRYLPPAVEVDGAVESFRAAIRGDMEALAKRREEIMKMEEAYVAKRRALAQRIEDLLKEARK